MKNKLLLLALSVFFMIFLISCEKANLVSEESEGTGLNDLFIYDVVNKTNRQITHTPDSVESRTQFYHSAPAILFFTGGGGFYMNVNETGKRKWINTLIFSTPHLSPDDRTIVYSLNKNLYLINPDGTNNRQLTHDNGDYQNPKWSPDGQKIACTKSGVLYLVTLDGQVKTLSSDYIEKCNWSRDSKMLVYYKFGNKSEIYKYDLDAQREVQLTNLNKFAYSPVFSPVNNKICFTGSMSSSGTDLIIMDSDGSNLTSICHKISIVDPCWSPDGNYLTFVAGNDNTNPSANIATCGADGSNFQIINEKQGNCWTPLWSKDGKYILYRRLVPLEI